MTLDRKLLAEDLGSELFTTLESTVTYIESLVTDGHIPEASGARGITAICRAHHGFPNLPIPTVGPGPDGILGITWRDDDHYLNVEIFPDGRNEVYTEHLKGKQNCCPGEENEDVS